MNEHPVNGGIQQGLSAARMPAPLPGPASRMEIKYALTVEDGLAFLRYHAKHPPGPQLPRGRKWIWGMLFLLFGLLSLPTLLASQKPIGWRDTLWPAFCGMALIAILFSDRLMALSWRRMLRRTELFLAPRQLIISAEGIEAVVGPRAARSAWDGVRKIVVTPDHAFFYISWTEAFILPRRAFADNLGFEHFVGQAERYLRGPAATGTALTSTPPAGPTAPPSASERPSRAEDLLANPGYGLRLWDLAAMDLADLSAMGWLLVLSTFVVVLATAVTFAGQIAGLERQGGPSLLPVLVGFGVGLLLGYCYFELGKRVLRLLRLPLYRKK